MMVATTPRSAMLRGAGSPLRSVRYACHCALQ